MNYFVLQLELWEDEKTDSSQGGRDFFFFNFRQLSVVASKVFSLALFHTCVEVLLLHQKGLILTLLTEGACNGVNIFPTW